MTEIWTMEGGQKDVFLRRAKVKKKTSIIKQKNRCFYFLVEIQKVIRFKFKIGLFSNFSTHKTLIIN